MLQLLDFVCYNTTSSKTVADNRCVVRPVMVPVVSVVPTIFLHKYPILMRSREISSSAGVSLSHPQLRMVALSPTCISSNLPRSLHWLCSPSCLSPAPVTLRSLVYSRDLLCDLLLVFVSPVLRSVIRYLCITYKFHVPYQQSREQYILVLCPRSHPLESSPRAPSSVLEPTPGH